MKRFASVLLAVVLMLSLSVFSYADTLMYGGEEQILPDDYIRPYALYPVDTNPDFLTTYYNFSEMVLDDNLLTGSGMNLFDLSPSGGVMNVFAIGHSTGVPMTSPTYWFNCIGKFVDANGYVLTTSDIDMYYLYAVNPSKVGWIAGQLDVASDNTYQFDDGYIQFCMRNNASLDSTGSYTGYLIMPRVTNTAVVSPISFELEAFEVYTNEEDSDTKPFVFGSEAHSSTPDEPVIKDPNVASDYGSAADQVEWYNDAYGSAVDPELADKTSEATDMILQQEEIESEVIDGLNQYSSQVDPANLSFPTQILNGLSFIGTTFMSSYNALGDIGFVMSLSMMLGVVMVIIGRGEGALARGISSRRNEDYKSYREASREAMRDMKKGG